MIIDIRGLRYKGQLVGVRVKTDTASFYDIGVDVYTDDLGLNPNTLKPVDLIEHGNLLVTRDELKSGILVQDASNNEVILEEIKVSALTQGGFLNKKNLSPEQLRIKLQKVKEELNGKYWRYFTFKREWLPEFIDYHIANFEGNSNIYNSLGSDQVIAVKAFFRWRSKLLFNEQHTGSKILHVKPTKTRELVALMGDASDWVFDGTVDTGYKGGGYCELGHSLRYEQYAYSQSLNKSIVFGSTCVSDFFKVDASVIRAINKAQEELLAELKVIVFIMKTGKYKEFIQLNYKNMQEVFKFYKGNLKGMGKNTEDWVKHISNFVLVNLPLTHSMVFAYTKLVEGSKEDTPATNVDHDMTKAKLACKKLGYPEPVIDVILNSKQQTELCKSLKVYIGKGRESDIFVKRGVGIIPLLQIVIDNLTTFSSYIHGLEGFISRKYYFVTAKNGRRLATKNEIRYKVPTLIEETYLRGDKTSKLLLLTRFASKHTSNINWSYTEFKTSESFANKFLASYTELLEALDWGMSDNFISEIRPALSLLQQPSSVTDELVNTYSLEFRYDFIMKNQNLLSQTDINRFSQVRNYLLTDSKPLIDALYSKLDTKLTSKKKRETPVINNIVPVNFDDEVVLKTIEEAIEKGAISKDAFVCKVLLTVRANGRISDKQRKYIMDAYKT